MAMNMPLPPGRPAGRPPIRRNPRLAAAAQGMPGLAGLLGVEESNETPAQPMAQSPAQGLGAMLAMRQALARAVAARQKGRARG
jgi:hypothetical protein